MPSEARTLSAQDTTPSIPSSRLSEEIPSPYNRPFPFHRLILRHTQRSFPFGAGVVLINSDGVGNPKVAVDCATEAGRIAGTSKLLRWGFADWANEGHGQRSILIHFLVNGSLNLALTNSANRTVINSAIASTSQLVRGSVVLPSRSPRTFPLPIWGFCPLHYLCERSIQELARSNTRSLCGERHGHYGVNLRSEYLSIGHGIAYTACR